MTTLIRHALVRALIHATVGTAFVVLVLLADATGDRIHDPGFDATISWSEQ